MQIHLVDGTYELFRHFFAVPSHRNSRRQEVGAVRGVLSSIFSMIREGATHIGVATDHVVESFRNDLYPGYKTSEGVAPELLSQFPILEEVLSAAGFVVWPMTDFEADDALASAATIAAKDKRVERVFLCTPDKDLAQCVSGTRIVQLNRRTRIVTDEDGVIEKFGVPPTSIPDYLALVGDSADGYPGLSGWGAKKTAAVLARYPHFEDIPADSAKWDLKNFNATKLGATFRDDLKKAILFRTLATLRSDIPLFKSVDELRWKGPTDKYAATADSIDASSMKVPSPSR